MIAALGLGEAYSLACAACWGVAVVLFKKSGESLAPFELNLFKNGLGLVLMSLTIALLQAGLAPPLPWDAVLLCLLSGVLGIGLGDWLYFHALNTVGASRMAVVQTLYSPFVILLSMVFLAERLAWLQWLGVALVLGGILLVTWHRDAAAADPRRLLRGAALGALSVLAMAAGVVIAKPLLERHDFLWVVNLRIVGGVLGMLAVVLWRGSARQILRRYAGVQHWGVVIAGAVIGTYVSMLVWMAGYKYTQASIAAVLNELAAVFILVLAVVFLKESVSRRQVGGMVVALAGVVLVVL